MGSDYSAETNALLKMKVLNPRLRGGAALMLALWALFLLSAMIISWALDINSRLVVSGNAGRVLDAEAMASSGGDIALAEVALRPKDAPNSPNLHGRLGNQEGYDVQIRGECGRLDVKFLTLGEDPAKLEILRRYLTLKGVELNDLDTMMDSLLDWVSPGQGIHHLNACPETDDYRPPHAPLTSVDDLKKICGWAEFTAKPGWDEDFTLINCGGPIIDIGWASRDVLRALLGALGGVGDDRVDAFLQLRRGSDGIDGTIDDPQLDLPTALTTLGFRGGRTPENLGLTPSPPKTTTVFRVTSIGKSGDVTRTVQMIVSGGGGLRGRPQVISWKEL